LSDFEDTQSAFFLLRTSFNIVRATHFMRTTPLALWAAEAAKFDGLVRRAAGDILGFPLSDQSYLQASLTPGMGLRRAVVHADSAFAASRREAQSQWGEVWSPPPPAGPSQKEASFALDEAALASLLDQAPDARERQRLWRLCCEHAGAWVSAVPSSVDGVDTIMRPTPLRSASASPSFPGVPLVLSACKPLILWAITPHAAARQAIPSSGTTASATW